MPAPSTRADGRDTRAARWRAQRRCLLLGPVATWALSACGALGSANRDSRDADPAEATETGPRDRAADSGDRVANVVRELTFSRPQRVVNHLAWSPDGDRLAVGGLLDTQITVLDVVSGAQLPAPTEQFGGIRGLAYSPDGRYLAVSRGGVGPPGVPADQGRYTVSLWDPRTGSPLQRLVEPDPAAIVNMATYALSFSSDARYLAVAYQRETAIYALAEQHTYRRVLILPPATGCAFRPGSSSLACLRMQRGGEKIVLYHVPDGRAEPELDGPAQSLAWSPDGRLLATAAGPRVSIVDVAGDRPALALAVTHPDVRIHSLSFSADGRWCAGLDHVGLELWETGRWSHAATLRQKTRFMFAGGFSPRGRLVAAAGYTPITLWKIADPPRTAERGVIDES